MEGGDGIEGKDKTGKYGKARRVGRRGGIKKEKLVGHVSEYRGFYGEGAGDG